MSLSRLDRVPYSVAGFGHTLTHDLAYGVPSAVSLFSSQDVSAVLEKLETQTYPREELAATLDAALAAFNPPDAVRANVRRLRESNTFVVATGQQAGFLGGPLFTLHKAMTAVKMARHLEQLFEGRAQFVPVFWVAADDHDLAEIDHAFVLQNDGSVARIKISLSPESAGCSAANAFMDRSPESVNAFRAELSNVLKDPQAVDDIVTLYSRESLAGAFTALLLRWVGHTGLVVASSTAARKFGSPILQRDVAEFDITARLIQEAGVRMKTLGYEPGFSAQMRSAPHFFIDASPVRLRAALEVVESGSGVSFRERSSAFEPRNQQPRSYSGAELSALIESQPELFSASAALRPLVQQKAFPVVATVLGPGEIDYWAQLKAVFAHFGIVFPVIVPRASLTLIDGSGEKAMRKLSIAAGSPDLFLDAEVLEKRALVSNDVASRMQRHVAAIVGELAAIEDDVQQVDGGLKPLFDKARERITHELQRVAEKTQASLGQREGAGVARAHYLSSLVRPKKSLQERTLACAPFMLRFPALADDLLEAIDPLAREHFVITLA